MRSLNFSHAHIIKAVEQSQSTMRVRSNVLYTMVRLVPDTSYLRGSAVFRSFPAQVSVKVREDICSATAPLLRTTRTDSAEGFAAGLCTSDCVDSR